jgi:hypothetical protein
MGISARLRYNPLSGKASHPVGAAAIRDPESTGPEFPSRKIHLPEPVSKVLLRGPIIRRSTSVRRLKASG